MSLKNIHWEAFFLAFAFLFTVLLAGANALMLFFKIHIPELLTLLVSIATALVFATKQVKR